MEGAWPADPGPFPAFLPVRDTNDDRRSFAQKLEDKLSELPVSAYAPQTAAPAALAERAPDIINTAVLSAFEDAAKNIEQMAEQAAGEAEVAAADCRAAGKEAADNLRRLGQHQAAAVQQAAALARDMMRRAKGEQDRVTQFRTAGVTPAQPQQPQPEAPQPEPAQPQPQPQEQQPAKPAQADASTVGAA